MTLFGSPEVPPESSPLPGGLSGDLPGTCPEPIQRTRKLRMYATFFASCFSRAHVCVPANCLAYASHQFTLARGSACAVLARCLQKSAM